MKYRARLTIAAVALLASLLVSPTHARQEPVPDVRGCLPVLAIHVGDGGSGLCGRCSGGCGKNQPQMNADTRRSDREF